MEKKLRFESFVELTKDKSTKAAKQAQELGLNYVGFGRYEDPKTGKISHIVKNDNLEPFNAKAHPTGYGSYEFGDESQQDIGDMKQAKTALRDQRRTNWEENSALEDYEVKGNMKHIHALTMYTGSNYYKPIAYMLNKYKPEQMLSPEAIKDIEAYSEDYENFMPDEFKQGDTHQAIERMMRIIGDIDDVFDHNEMPKDATLYSSLKPSRWSIEDFKEGSIFKFKGFRSTSIDPGAMFSYTYPTAQKKRKDEPDQMQKDIDIVLEIKAKKGDKALPVMTVSPFNHEAEVLLPRNAPIKVISGPKKIKWSINSDYAESGKGKDVYVIECELAKEINTDNTENPNGGNENVNT
jgi:hypothetical protein